MIFRNKRILILSPHIDDGEIAMGGTIARLIEDGNEVFYLSFSFSDVSLPEGFNIDDIKNESSRARAVLGIKKDNFFAENYQTRHFASCRQAILEDMVAYGKKILPEVVFSPSSTDIHQDHEVIYKEALRAFRYGTLLGFEHIKNNLSWENRLFISLTEEHVRKKLEAINCFESQMVKGTLDLESLRGLAKMRGAQVRIHLAESFEVIRMIKAI